MKNIDRRPSPGPALFLLAGLIALVSRPAWAVAGAGPPDVGAAMEGLLYLVVGLTLFGAILVIWIARKLVSKWRKRRNEGHDETG